MLLFLAVAAVSAENFDAEGEFARLTESGSEDPQAWYQLAVGSRGVGDLDTASRALDRAVELQISPIQSGLERARILTVAGRGSVAVDELQALAEQGFTAVGVITGDPVLSVLAGDKRYDRIVADMSVQAYPCEHQEKFREFDFWIGEWDVHIANGTLAGHNRIERAQRGCVLIENWTSVTGGTGMSMNYFDKATDEWVQVWMAGGGSQIIIRGGLTDEGMSLVGNINYVNTGQTFPFRGLWTPLPDGRVRQFFEQSADDGATWTPWFEGFYTRRESQE